MSSTDELQFERIENMTPEKCELRDKICEVIWLRRQIQDLRTAARLITSTVWTPEAREYVNAIADGAAPAIKSLDDQLKILELKIKALEAST